jgi:hypothetical protein
MADFREIHEFQMDAARSRRLACVLSANSQLVWSDWELDFLESMCAQKSELSTRQAEKLLELRDEAHVYRKADGILISTLIRRCFEARLDLDSDQDVAFVERLKAADAGQLHRSPALRLVRIARQLGIIEPHAGGYLTA